jgi:hypothetical protein
MVNVLSDDKAELFIREIGQGQPIIVIAGGPDFDHTYLLPDMDALRSHLSFAKD